MHRSRSVRAHGWSPAFIMIWIVALWPGVTSCEEFRWMEAMSFEGMPDLRTVGLERASIIAHWMWPKSKISDQLPSRTLVNRHVKNAVTAGQKIIILDIEHWPVTGADYQVKDSIMKYRTVAQWAADAGPDAVIGYYGVAPIRDYWRALLPPNNYQYQRWQRENSRIAEIVQDVKALFPSLYTFYDDPLGWERYAVANLKEARRISGGKPVYAFLWPYYHESNRKLSGTPLRGDYWRRQLKLVREHADGVVIWGGWQQRWDPNAAWWLETLSMLAADRNKTAE